LQLQKKLLRLKLLQLLDQHYPQVFRVYHPNDTLHYPKEVDELRNAATLNDESLLFSDNYIQFLGSYYRKASQAATDSGFYEYVVQHFPAGKTKDIFLFRSLSDFISIVPDSAKRQYFIDNFGKNISSGKLLTSLHEKNRSLNSMKRGKPAPEIHAETLNGQPFVLSALKNRFVVVDVWATWCGPCKKEAPYFKELADRYTSERIAFVSLSIDEKKNDWKVEAMDKAEKVLQLWATNAEKEMKNYNIEFIPRFMLIDNKGRILNANMPRPSDPEFENILQKETAAFTR
jgi:thiol-disulfide isomerase/thioredoxin